MRYFARKIIQYRQVLAVIAFTCGVAAPAAHASINVNKPAPQDQSFTLDCINSSWSKKSPTGQIVDRSPGRPDNHELVMVDPATMQYCTGFSEAYLDKKCAVESSWPHLKSYEDKYIVLFSDVSILQNKQGEFIDRETMDVHSWSRTPDGFVGEIVYKCQKKKAL